MRALATVPAESTAESSQALRSLWLAEVAKKYKPPLRDLRAWLDSAADSAGTVARALMALLANARDGLEFSNHQYPGGRKIMPALEGPAVWSPLAIEESACTRGLSYWVFCSGKGSTEGKAERDLLMGVANLSRIIIIGKPSSGEGFSVSSELGWAWLWVWQ
jgi:hypothetical protein